jgi:hypothetical protein
MSKLQVGDILIADSYCGITDNTTQGKEYIVSKVNEMFDGGTMFWIIDDKNQERFPISTTFKKKN